jgi:hypothetical protein
VGLLVGQCDIDEAFRSLPPTCGVLIWALYGISKQFRKGFSPKFANSSGIRALLDTRGMLQPLRTNRTSREKEDSYLPSF